MILTLNVPIISDLARRGRYSGTAHIVRSEYRGQVTFMVY